MKNLRTITTLLLLSPPTVLTVLILDKSILHIPKELYLFNTFIISLFFCTLIILLVYMIYAIRNKWNLNGLNTYDKVKFVISAIIFGLCLLAWGLVFIVTSN